LATPAGLLRRFGSGSRQEPSAPPDLPSPGLLLDDSNDTWVVDRFGVAWKLPGTGGDGKNTIMYAVFFGGAA
jgi:hypothetical protein